MCRKICLTVYLSFILWFICHISVQLQEQEEDEMSVLQPIKVSNYTYTYEQKLLL